MADAHPAKIEIFDIPARCNRDPKGVDRPVEEFRQTPFGLYMARPAPGRKQFHFIESWFLPDFGLRVTDFWFSPGYEKDQDFYLDIVDISHSSERWEVTDLYVDVIVRSQRGVSVADTDELLASARRGFITDAQAQRALERTYRTLLGLAEHRYDLAAWLAEHDIQLSWRRR